MSHVGCHRQSSLGNRSTHMSVRAMKLFRSEQLECLSNEIARHQAQSKHLDQERELWKRTTILETAMRCLERDMQTLDQSQRDAVTLALSDEIIGVFMFMMINVSRLVKA